MPATCRKHRGNLKVAEKTSRRMPGPVNLMTTMHKTVRPHNIQNAHTSWCCCRYCCPSLQPPFHPCPGMLRSSPSPTQPKHVAFQCSYLLSRTSELFTPLRTAAPRLPCCPCTLHKKVEAKSFFFLTWPCPLQDDEALDLAVQAVHKLGPGPAGGVYLILRPLHPACGRTDFCQFLIKQQQEVGVGRIAPVTYDVRGRTCVNLFLKEPGVLVIPHSSCTVAPDTMLQHATS
jgi:hypothetical protein